MQYLKHEIGTKTQRDTMFVWKSLYVMKSKQPITDIKMLHLFCPSHVIGNPTDPTLCLDHKQHRGMVQD